MKFGIRREVDLNDIRGRLPVELFGVPIELALPWKKDDYMQQREYLPALVEHLKSSDIVVQNIHATQGRLSDPDVMVWGLDAIRLAEAAGAHVVVFHPDNVKKDAKANQQILIMQNIRRLQRQSDKVTVAIETFGGPKRSFTPEEIIDKGLPMVLDTSHLFQDRTMQIIDKYHSGVVSVHLSEERYDEQEKKSMPHMPIEDFGFKVLDLLAEKEWDGVVTLEYLPWHHHRLLPDRIMLERKYERTVERPMP